MPPVGALRQAKISSLYLIGWYYCFLFGSRAGRSASELREMEQAEQAEQAKRTRVDIASDASGPSCRVNIAAFLQQAMITLLTSKKMLSLLTLSPRLPRILRYHVLHD